MATQTKSTTQSKSPDIVTRAREAGVGAVDAYEQAVDRVLSFQESAAEATKLDWIVELTNGQAQVVRDVTAAYTRTARELLQ